MKLAHFYHCWCAGQWEKPVEEHIQALIDSGFDQPITVGLVGPVEQRVLARDAFRSAFPSCETIEADKGWEPFTLSALHAYAQDHDGAVLYAHTHGAWRDDAHHALHRRRTIEGLVSRWRECLRRVDQEGFDAVGSDWPGGSYPGGRIFTDNCWMARCDYVRTLPVLSGLSTGRHDGGNAWSAEHWISVGAPKVIEAPVSHPAERLSAARNPVAYAARCVWDGRRDRAAGDLFLLDELERWKRRLLDAARFTGDTRHGVPIAAFPEQALRSSVETTRAACPGWDLTGGEQQPILERLDLHFEPVHRAWIEWRGWIPVGTAELVRAADPSDPGQPSSRHHRSDPAPSSYPKRATPRLRGSGS